MSSTARVALVAVLLMSAAPGAEQLGRIFGRDPKFKPFTSGSLVMEYPENWVVHPGAGTMLVTFATSRADASVGIERTKLSQPLDASEMTEISVKLEEEDIKDQYPDATSITSTLVTHPSLGRAIRSEFSRPGSSGALDRLRQFSVPAGTVLYRILCRARAVTFEKHEPTFERMVGSVRITPPKSNEGAR